MNLQKIAQFAHCVTMIVTSLSVLTAATAADGGDDDDPAHAPQKCVICGWMERARKHIYSMQARARANKR